MVDLHVIISRILRVEIDARSTGGATTKEKPLVVSEIVPVSKKINNGPFSL